jgi:asparagine synthetase B (glutamine-hydrolysing)
MRARWPPFLGTVHHEMVYTLQEGIDALSDVIYHIESYDVTTVRASTPMFLMARKIRALGIKMVLSGEGADEVFGGYLYFHKAPNAKELYAETVRKVGALHNYDCLRANKSMAAWGIETRVPFLDRHLLDLAMCIDPELKLPSASDSKMEKHILRAAFDRDEDPYLPKSVLWRQKEQFSDGVGYGWIDGLRDYADAPNLRRAVRHARVSLSRKHAAQQRGLSLPLDLRKALSAARGCQDGPRGKEHRLQLGSGAALGRTVGRKSRPIGPRHRNPRKRLQRIRRRLTAEIPINV